jgi:hypothetical protein
MGHRQLAGAEYHFNQKLASQPLCVEHLDVFAVKGLTNIRVICSLRFVEKLRLTLLSRRFECFRISWRCRHDHRPHRHGGSSSPAGPHADPSLNG